MSGRIAWAHAYQFAIQQGVDPTPLLLKLNAVSNPEAVQSYSESASSLLHALTFVDAPKESIRPLICRAIKLDSFCSSESNPNAAIKIEEAQHAVQDFGQTVFNLGFADQETHDALEVSLDYFTKSNPHADDALAKQAPWISFLYYNDAQTVRELSEAKIDYSKEQFLSLIQTLETLIATLLSLENSPAQQKKITILQNFVEQVKLSLDSNDFDLNKVLEFVSSYLELFSDDLNLSRVLKNLIETGAWKFALVQRSEIEAPAKELTNSPQVDSKPSPQSPAFYNYPKNLILKDGKDLIQEISIYTPDLANAMDLKTFDRLPTRINVSLKLSELISSPEVSEDLKQQAIFWLVKSIIASDNRGKGNVLDLLKPLDRLPQKYFDLINAIHEHFGLPKCLGLAPAELIQARSNYFTIAKMNLASSSMFHEILRNDQSVSGRWIWKSMNSTKVGKTPTVVMYSDFPFLFEKILQNPEIPSHARDLVLFWIVYAAELISSAQKLAEYRLIGSDYGRALQIKAAFFAANLS